MMPLVSVGWDVLALALCLAGFFFLIFANEREGRRLLHRPASRRERRLCAAAGSVLLFLALWVCIQEWRGSFGSVVWFGWLTVAALALIFGLAGSGDGRQRTGKASGASRRGEGVDCHGAAARGNPEGGSARFAVSGKTAAASRLKRGLLWGAFVLLPCLFLLSAWRVDPWAVLREEVVQGKAGPWAFTLAEVEPAAPTVGGAGVAMKAFELRFADDALPEIRAAYLRARKPRSLKAAGMAFEGNFLRTAKIIIPPAFLAEEGIWLTVEGRNGEVHHAAVDVARLSPALARFLAGEEPAQKSREGWESTLRCWHEAEEVVCQGADFGSGETRFMDGTAIEVSGDGDNGNGGEILLSARLNRKGEIRFPRPEGAFHVLMEEGPG
ncbi:MAG: DUF3325 domain-containing protein, partial [Zoogloeaceae bacterium]|nr:DUF3325 domain-containing protein [Zoogloeaceae bacterium]